MTIVSWKARFAAAIAALWIAALPARAQSVEAEALFREGKRLIKEGNLAAGCEKLEASDRLEPSVGTELNLGDCREKNGQLASAWAAFLKAAGNAKKAGNDKGRETEARNRAAKLEPRLSYLTISVPQASRVAGLTIARNGTTIDEALWNSGVPVDVGTYQITGQAPGHEPWNTTAKVVGEGARVSVEVPRFKSIEEMVAKTSGPVGPTTQPEGQTEPEPSVEKDVATPGMFTTKRKIAVGVAAIGVLGASAAVVFGLKAKDLQKQADDLCPDTTCSNQMAIDLNDDAKSAALKTNIGIGIGVAGVAGAVVLWVLGAPVAAPSADEDEEAISLRPVVGQDRVMMSLGGRF
jgi:hypothetical protein